MTRFKLQLSRDVQSLEVRTDLGLIYLLQLLAITHNMIRHMIRDFAHPCMDAKAEIGGDWRRGRAWARWAKVRGKHCLLYTSDAADDTPC
eukprot:1119163-Pleurochrysis_carterae.AAC.3